MSMRANNAACERSVTEGNLPNKQAKDAEEFLPLSESLIDYDDLIDSWNGRKELKPP